MTPANDKDVILSPREVLRRTNLSRATIYRMTKRDEFPKPVQLSPRRIGWSAAQVDGWLAGKLSQVAA